MTFNIERLNELKSKIGLFDLIFSSVTWFYLKDPLSALVIAYELLKDGGWMVIDGIKIDPGLNEELRHWLIKNGFKVIKIKYSSPTMDKKPDTAS